MRWFSQLTRRDLLSIAIFIALVGLFAFASVNFPAAFRSYSAHPNASFGPGWECTGADPAAIAVFNNRGASMANDALSELPDF
jgi:hypothetical protein